MSRNKYIYFKSQTIWINLGKSHHFEKIKKREYV